MVNQKEMSEDKILEDETAPSSTESATPTAPAPADLLRTAADPDLTEDLALALLKRADLPPEVLEQLAKNANALKSRKVKIALASHPHTPRHVSVPLARQFYTFDLMKVALSPSVPADVKSCGRRCPYLAPQRCHHRRTSDAGPPRLGQSSRCAPAGCGKDGRQESWRNRRANHRCQNRGAREPSHADRARKPAPHRSPRHQLRASARRQRSPGACGRAAREVVTSAGKSAPPCCEPSISR